jgi:hypothetical protein
VGSDTWWSDSGSVSTYRNSSGLAYTYSRSVSVPTTTPLDTYSVTVTLDPDALTADTDRSNNLVTLPGTIRVY